LIAQRSSKFRALEKLVGKTIRWQMLSPTAGYGEATIVECNQFFLIVGKALEKRSFPIDWISISFDPHYDQYHLWIRG
jgi:hypothetical protein